MSSVTSLSFCELYRLRRDPFEELQSKFQDTFEGFKQAAKLEAKNQKKQASRLLHGRHPVRLTH